MFPDLRTSLPDPRKWIVIWVHMPLVLTGIRNILRNFPAINMLYKGIDQIHSSRDPRACPNITIHNPPRFWDPLNFRTLRRRLFVLQRN